MNNTPKSAYQVSMELATLVIAEVRQLEPPPSVIIEEVTNGSANDPPQSRNNSPERPAMRALPAPEREESAETEWQELQAYLERARNATKEARQLEIEAGNWLDDFIARHGDTAYQLATENKNWPRMINDLRGARQAGKSYMDKLKELRRVEQEELEQKEKIARFQQESHSKAAQLAESLRETHAKHAKIREELGWQQAPRKERKCFRCGLPGIDRGRECPNRANHHLYPNKQLN